jgi:SnoaL-like domain
MGTPTTASFELARFSRAVEERDTETQVSQYAPDAVVTIADRITQPGSPRVLKGVGEIGAWIKDVNVREMTHKVLHSVSDDHAGALVEACRYPDGTNVLCTTVFELEDGAISRQIVVQAWDEAEAPARQKTEHKSFLQPDETRAFPNGKAEILSIGDADVGRMTFQPGWRWSNDVKPVAGTDSCEAPHFQYHVSGRLAIRMDDSTEITAGPGDVTSLPSGHDAWVVGDEPVVVVDFYGASNYAKSS